ncbi:MAG TPA: hypothetical protein VMB52_02625 [Verrucomicrobiae bacterium]|nr:hypothetical protein [Verrucomicrobiae bacterium]
MEKTVVADWLHQDKVGYLVACFLSEASQRIVTELLGTISKQLPEVVFKMPPDQQHITLFEIIIQLWDYPGDKDELYEEHKEEIECSLAELFADQPPISITFDTLEASSQAIIIKGTDDGSFQRLRKMATQRPIIQADKLPPTIVHSSIARYTKSVDLKMVQDVVSGCTVSFQEEVKEFSLRRVFRTPMETELIHRYPLKV